MKASAQSLVLAGNGPYDNRGCEAIVRGTVEILRHFFPSPKFVVVSNYRSKSMLEYHRRNETDDAITHEKINKPYKKLSPLWWLSSGMRAVFPKGRPYLTYKNMIPYLKEATAVLSIGGDNYSLDYDIPRAYTELDDLVLSKKRPIIIWGASIGPFTRLPEYEEFMIKHLKKVTAIFIRESATLAYLKSKGLSENLYRVADPAFLMKPVKPSDDKFRMNIPEGSIGLNLSPLMRKYVTDGNMNEWVKKASLIVREVLRRSQRPLFLIPHVTNPHTDDHEFLKNVLSILNERKLNVELVPPDLNASEIKWVISKMAVFAGARMHSVIAAISTGVPSLMFSYSIKAEGLSRDIYGDTQLCLSPDNLAPEVIAEKIESMLKDKDTIKKRINLLLPDIIQSAMNAGKYLKEIVG